MSHTEFSKNEITAWAPTLESLRALVQSSIQRGLALLLEEFWAEPLRETQILNPSGISVVSNILRASPSPLSPSRTNQTHLDQSHHRYNPLVSRYKKGDISGEPPSDAVDRMRWNMEIFCDHAQSTFRRRAHQTLMTSREAKALEKAYRCLEEIITASEQLTEDDFKKIEVPKLLRFLVSEMRHYDDEKNPSSSTIKRGGASDSQKLFNEFKQADGYNIMTECAVWLAKLPKESCKRMLESSSTSSPSSSQKNMGGGGPQEVTKDTLLSVLLESLADFVFSGPVALPVPTEKTDVTAFNPSNRTAQTTNGFVDDPLRVRSLDGFMVLMNVFNRVPLQDFKLEVLNRVLMIFSGHADNYWLLYPLQVTASLIKGLPDYTDQVRSMVMKIVDSVAVVVQAVPFQELTALSVVLSDVGERSLERKQAKTGNKRATEADARAEEKKMRCMAIVVMRATLDFVKIDKSYAELVGKSMLESTKNLELFRHSACHEAVMTLTKYDTYRAAALQILTISADQRGLSDMLELFHLSKDEPRRRLDIMHAICRMLSSVSAKEIWRKLAGFECM
eukprot:jgi/Bigna1/71951/fgenesh1_pg.17_\